MSELLRRLASALLGAGCSNSRVHEDADTPGYTLVPGNAYVENGVVYRVPSIPSSADELLAAIDAGAA